MYIFPRPIQEVLNRIDRSEVEFFLLHPETNILIREIEREEVEAEAYRVLMEPQKIHTGCYGCCNYMIVVASPSRAKRLHFMARTVINSPEDLNQMIVPGFTELLSVTDDDSFDAKEKELFYGEKKVREPIVYKRVKL